VIVEGFLTGSKLWTLVPNGPCIACGFSTHYKGECSHYWNLPGVSELMEAGASKELALFVTRPGREQLQLDIAIQKVLIELGGSSDIQKQD